MSLHVLPALHQRAGSISGTSALVCFHFVCHHLTLFTTADVTCLKMSGFASHRNNSDGYLSPRVSLQQGSIDTEGGFAILSVLTIDAANDIDALLVDPDQLANPFEMISPSHEAVEHRSISNWGCFSLCQG